MYCVFRSVFAFTFLPTPNDLKGTHSSGTSGISVYRPMLPLSSHSSFDAWNNSWATGKLHSKTWQDVYLNPNATSQLVPIPLPLTCVLQLGSSPRWCHKGETKLPDILKCLCSGRWGNVSCWEKWFLSLWTGTSVQQISLIQQECFYISPLFLPYTQSQAQSEAQMHSILILCDLSTSWFESSGQVTYMG